MLIFFSKAHKLSIFFLNDDFLMISSRVSSLEFLFLLFEIIYYIIISNLTYFQLVYIGINESKIYKNSDYNK